MPTIFDIKRFALHDGPGIRTTVFLKGCPLSCKWCHNPESHNAEPEEYTEQRMMDGKEISMARIYGKKVSHEALLEEILKDKVFFRESGGGATFSGGEPLMQYRALLELLKDTGREGLHRVVDTSGYASRELLMRVAEHTDLFLYDLKIMDPGRHLEYTGVDNRLILGNADRLLEAGAEVIFRIPVIPGVNDTEKEISAFLDFFRKREGTFNEVHLLPYHKIGTGKYKRIDMEYQLNGMEAPREEGMQQIKKEIEQLGLQVTIGG